LRDRADAKVLGRSEVSNGVRDGFAAVSATGNFPAVRRLSNADEEEAENGFEGAVLVFVENGFVEVELGNDFVPNKLSPKSIPDFGLATSPLEILVTSSCGLSLAVTSVILMPRSAFTLPSLRLQVFRRHVITYKRLSCPGKCSGRSPFNCRSRIMRSLQTLHFANAAEGGIAGSSQVWGKQRQHTECMDITCFAVATISVTLDDLQVSRLSD